MVGIFSLLFLISIFYGLQYENLVLASAIGFVAMMVGSVVGHVVSSTKPKFQSISFGLGSGMMIMSAFLIIAPKSMAANSSFISSVGGIGIAFGYIFGYALHEIGHILSHQKDIKDILYTMKVAEITAHSLLAGSLMGIAYSTIPDLSIVFGFGVVAHKLPAGFTTVIGGDKSVRYKLMIIPATMVGISGVVSASLVPEVSGLLSSLVFGLSAGLFLHVAVDMTPECVQSDDTHSQGNIVCSTEQDKIRLISVSSVLLGASIIAVLWFLIA